MRIFPARGGHETTKTNKSNVSKTKTKRNRHESEREGKKRDVSVVTISTMENAFVLGERRGETAQYKK